MEFRDIEGLAMAVRRGAGAGPEDVVSVVDTIVFWLGAGSVERVDRMVGRAALVTVDGRARIMARRGAPDLRFALAHELGHWALRHVGHVSLDPVEEERAANLFAATLLAPCALMRRAYEFFGEAHETIAAKINLSQTSTILRLGEVRGDSRAVVTRSGHVLARNTNATFTRERASAAARGKGARGLARARLRGGIDEGRVAVRVA